jgi:bla regulator protein blaR1
MISFDLHALGDALRDTAPVIGNHLWQSTAFSAVAWVLTLSMRKNSAQVRFGLWLAASIKFLLPFSVLIALGGMLPRPRHAVVTMPVYSAVDSAGMPFDQTPDLRVAPADAARTAQEEAPTPILPLALLGLWLGGATVVIAKWSANWRRVASVRRNAVRVEDGREVAILRGLEREMTARKPRRPMPLLLSTDSMEPGVLGVLHPVLIWPKELSAQLDDKHIEAILAHELMHVRRHDNLTAALHMLVQAMSWFHPAVWWMGRQMIAERELACDEAVVALGNRRGIYAESLLKTVRFCVESPLACAAGITGADLKRRVHAIMRGRLVRLGWGSKAALTVLAAAAITVPVAFGMIRMIPLYGQIADAAGPLPAFEVASIKPSDAERRGKGFTTNGRHFSTLNTTASDLLQYAYEVQARQIVDAPAWLDADQFNITAVAGEGEPGIPNAWNLMMRKLLADRFGLAFHHDTRELPVYELRIGKNGPKLAKSSAGDGHTELYFSRTSKSSAGMTVHARNATMAGLAKLLQSNLQRPVVDRTGLAGSFDFTMDFTDTVKAGDAASPSGEADAPSIFTAIQEQIGLKLEPAKGPADVIVIDHIERPVFDSAKTEAVPTQGPRLVNVAMMQQPATSTRGSAIQAQTATEKPLEFEIATVKPSSAQAKDFGVGMDIQPGGLVKMVNVPAYMLVEFAYDVPYQSPRMSGGPDWARTERYDIEAKAPEGAIPGGLTNQERNGRVRLMMQALLAERFKLSIQREVKDIPVYDVVVGKAGPKLKPSKARESDCAAATTFDGMRCHALHGGQGQGLHGAAVTVADIVQFVESWSDRPMIDKTGLTGLYAIDTEGWVPMRQTAVRNPDAPGEGLSDPERQTLFGIFQGVGLRLEPATAPTEVYAINHLERPSEN